MVLSETKSDISPPHTVTFRRGGLLIPARDNHAAQHQASAGLSRAAHIRRQLKTIALAEKVADCGRSVDSPWGCTRTRFSGRGDLTCSGYLSEVGSPVQTAGTYGPRPNPFVAPVSQGKAPRNGGDKRRGSSGRHHKPTAARQSTPSGGRNPGTHHRA